MHNHGSPTFVEIQLASVKKPTILVRQVRFGCLHTEVYPNPRPIKENKELYAGESS